MHQGHLKTITTCDSGQFYVSAWLDHGAQILGQILFWIFLSFWMRLALKSMDVEQSTLLTVMWLGLIQPVEDLASTKRLAPQNFAAYGLWTWTATLALSGSPTYQPTLQTLDLSVSIFMWSNSLKWIFIYEIYIYDIYIYHMGCVPLETPTFSHGWCNLSRRRLEDYSWLQTWGEAVIWAILWLPTGWPVGWQTLSAFRRDCCFIFPVRVFSSNPWKPLTLNVLWEKEYIRILGYLTGPKNSKPNEEFHDRGRDPGPSSFHSSCGLSCWSLRGVTLYLLTITCCLKMSSSSTDYYPLPPTHHWYLLVYIFKRNLIDWWLGNGLPPPVRRSLPPQQ